MSGLDVAGLTQSFETVATCGEEHAGTPGHLMAAGQDQSQFGFGFGTGGLLGESISVDQPGGPKGQSDPPFGIDLDWLGAGFHLFPGVVDPVEDPCADFAGGGSDLFGLTATELSQGGFASGHGSIEDGEDVFGGEDVGEEGSDAIEVGLLPIGDLEDGLGDQTFEGAINGHAAVVEHLVHAMGQEGEVARGGFVVDPVVVAVGRITIPVLGQDLQGGVGDEAVHIEPLFEALAALGEITETGGAGQ